MTSSATSTSSFETPKPPILLIGVGGAGGRIVDDTVAQFGIDREMALAIDTDVCDISKLTCCRSLVMGQSRFDGSGAAGNVQNAIAAAKEESSTLEKLLTDARLAVVVVGLGGGTGSGVGSEILQLARMQNIPTLVFTLSPFSFEPEERRQTATSLRATFEEHGAVVVHLQNDELAKPAGPDATLEEARTAASRTAADGIALLWRMIQHPAYLGLNIRSMSELLRARHGRAHFATATATGDGRVAESAKALFAPSTGVLSEALSVAPAVAYGILGGSDLRLREVDEAMQALRGVIRPECEVHLGTVLEPKLEGSLSLSVLVFEPVAGSVTIQDTTEIKPPPIHDLSTGEAPHTPGTTDSHPAPPQPQGGSTKPKSTSRPKSPPPPTTNTYFSCFPPYEFNGENVDIPTYQRRGLTIHAN